jgi:hypothetical protein
MTALDLRRNGLGDEVAAMLISAYWNDLRKDHVALDRMRLMIVGYGGVGKTTLSMAMQPNGLADVQKTITGSFLSLSFA